MNENAGFSKGTWSKGFIRGKNGMVFSYAVKHYGTGSEWGIDGGKISKLEMRRIDGRTMVLYERGWTHKPDTSNEGLISAYSELLRRFN